MFQERLVKQADGTERPAAFPEIEAEADYCALSKDYEGAVRRLACRPDRWEARIRALSEQIRQLPVLRQGLHRPRSPRKQILYQVRQARRPRPVEPAVEELTGRNLAELPRRVVQVGPAREERSVPYERVGVMVDYRRNVESYEAVFQILYRNGGTQPYEYCRRHRRYETGTKGAWGYCPWMDGGRFEWSGGSISKFLEELENRQSWREMKTGRMRAKRERLVTLHRERTNDALARILGGYWDE